MSTLFESPVTRPIHAYPYQGRAGYLRWCITRAVYVNPHSSIFVLPGVVMVAPSGHGWCIGGCSNSTRTLCPDPARPWWRQDWTDLTVGGDTTVEDTFAYAATWPGIEFVSA